MVKASIRASAAHVFEQLLVGLMGSLCLNPVHGLVKAQADELTCLDCRGAMRDEDCRLGEGATTAAPPPDVLCSLIFGVHTRLLDVSALPCCLLCLWLHAARLQLPISGIKARHRANSLS